MYDKSKTIIFGTWKLFFGLEIKNYYYYYYYYYYFILKNNYINIKND